VSRAPSEREHAAARRQGGLLLAALFLGGGLAGLALAVWLAPDSGIAAAAGLLALPAAFVAGLYVWLGLALITTLIRLILPRRGAVARPETLAAARDPRRGSGAFLPFSVLAALAAGLIVGVLPSSRSFLLSITCFLALGIAYGRLLAGSVRSGRIPSPDADSW
jgi:hypothetical protein